MRDWSLAAEWENGIGEEGNGDSWVTHSGSVLLPEGQLQPMRRGDEQGVPAACLDILYHSAGGHDAAVNSEWTMFYLLFFSASLLLSFTF